MHLCTGMLNRDWVDDHVKFLIYYLCTLYDIYSHSTDVDECLEGNHICHQICLNHEGNYSCTCEVGCDLHADGFSCNGEYDLCLCLFFYFICVYSCS